MWDMGRRKKGFPVENCGHRAECGPTGAFGVIKSASVKVA